MRTRRTVSRRPFALALGLSAFLMFGAMADRSDAGLYIKVLDSTATAGGSGEFDVIVTNDGGTAFNISGFSVSLSVDAGSGVTFTDVTDQTSPAAPYIFGSQQWPPFTPPGQLPGTAFTGSDYSLIAPDYYQTIGAGETFGLLHVTYTVAAGVAAGAITVEIVNSGTTGLFDEENKEVGSQWNNGTITITGAPPVVPEPASIIALATAAALLPIPSLVRRTRRKDG